MAPAAWLFASLAVAAGCGGDGRTPVTVYSPHGRDQLVLMEHDFARLHPDIDLRWLDMGSQEILDRIRFERVNPQADVWFGGPTTIFDRGVADSLLAPYRPAWADRVGPGGIGPGDRYYPAYRTPAVIAYNNRAVPDSLAPRDWDDVLDPRWRDQVLIRDPMASGTLRALWGLIIERSLRETGDTTRAMVWLRRLDAQTRTYTLNPAILEEKLVRQEGVITLWDLPDLLIWQAKGIPFSYAFPARERDPVVLDMAQSVVAKGKIIMAGKTGAPIPPDWALDADGAPTTDPVAATQGFLRTMGDYKGSGLSIVVGMLSSMIAGAAMGPTLRDVYEDFAPLNKGHAFCAIRLDFLVDAEQFKRDMDAQIDFITAGRKAPGVDEILLPGEMEARTYRRQMADGIAMPGEVIDEIHRIGQRLGERAADLVAQTAA